MSVHLIRRGAFVLGALVATVAIVACGSSSTTTTSGSAAASASSTTGSGSGSAAGAGRGFSRNPAERAKLVACLKQHGVTLPSRPPGGGRAPGSSGSSGSSSGSSTTPGSGGGPGFGGGGRGSFFGGGGGPAANSKTRAAMQACGVNFRASAGRFNPAARKADVTKFVTCVAQHGYKLPTPNFSGKGPVFPRNIESNSKFQAAAKACANDLRPPGAPQGGGGPPPSNA
jgi:hypothetical protein